MGVRVSVERVVSNVKKGTEKNSGAVHRGREDPREPDVGPCSQNVRSRWVPYFGIKSP